MFDKQRLYEIENEVDKQIREIKIDLDKSTDSFVEGMRRGADLMFKAVREELRTEGEQE